MGKSKGIGCEVEVMDELSMRITRARARTLAMESAKTTRNNKKNKRKFDSRELEQCRSNCRRRLVRRRTRSETLRNSGVEEDIPTSRFSSKGSSELLNENLMKRSVIDLEEKEEEKNDKSTSSTSTCRRRRKGEKEIEIEEITPSSSFREESTRNNLESMERPSVVLARNNDDDERSEKISPTEAEIDDFFSTPEKEEETRFANKYNYDIAKDVPLNGRYEWVRLKP